MKKRKYISEFGLNMYTSYSSLIQVEDLEDIKDERDYHIYSILASPRISYLKDSFETNKNNISFILKKQIEDSFKKIEIKEVNLCNDLDHREINLSSKYPYNKLEFEISDEKWLSNLGFNDKHKKIELNSHDALGFFNHKVISEFEVLYVGQAFGKNGERIATDRLKSHSTLQKILIDYSSSHPDKQLHIFLFEFTPLINISIDGMTKEYTATDCQENRHFENIFNNPLKYNQIINITEAAMINYFKPQYNINFVNNFPDEDHKGYKQYYDLDYNSLVVEINLSFDGAGPMQLFSDSNRISNSFDVIKYDLFNDPNRKNMFDIFK